MPAMSAKTIFAFIAFALLTLLLYLGAVYMHNDTYVRITMETRNDSMPPQPQIYYSYTNGGFNEVNSAKPYKIEKRTFYFRIPSIDSVKTIRFDPDTKTNALSIKAVHLVRYAWFKQSTYALNMNQIRALHQIDQLVSKKNLLTFQTTGNDPQLSIEPAWHQISQARTLYLHILLTALIGVTLFFYLFNLYKDAEKEDHLYAKIILYALFFCFTLFKLNYYESHVRFGYPPDETMHLSYIKYVHTHHAIVPKFEKMPHYLSHPPLYYELMNLAYDDTISRTANVSQLRTLSMLIFIMAFIGILYLGFSASLSILGHFVYLTVLTSIPMHSYLGASLTNDTLAALGGILFILGFKRLLEEKYYFSTYALVMFGIFIAYFSKLTAALLIFFALLYYFIYSAWQKKWMILQKKDYALIVLFLIPIAYYQLSIMLSYHALVPTYNHTHPEAYLKSGFFVQEQLRQHLSPYEWFERMLHYIHGGWFGIHSHHSIGHENYKGFIGLLIAHIMAIIAMFLPCKQTSKSYCMIGKITLLAILSVQVVQYIFSYKAHLSTGYLGGLQPRYLLPFMFGFAIMASLFVERIKDYFWVVLFVILMCLHALYSDFFYFLLYYR